MTANRCQRELNRVRSVVAGLLIVMLASGCTHVVRGTVRPAPNLKPRPLSGQMMQVLLDDAALSKLLDQQFKTDPYLRPWIGNRGDLRSAYGKPSRTDCLGVIQVQEKGSYQSADVKDVAGEIWWHEGGSAKVISVTEGIVTLPTAADANALFAKFTAQWQQCDGVTMDLPGEGLSLIDTIGDVRIANSVLAATVSVKSSTSGYDKARPEARAIGVRVNCLVEVEVAFYSSVSPSDPGSADVHTSSIDIAHIMMDKISALT